jgi:hypothetical protein
VTYIDDAADGTILAGSDTAPNDYKQVKMFILNTVTSGVVNFVTSVSPKNLEGLANAGAVLVKVINASGQPVSGAIYRLLRALSYLLQEKAQKKPLRPLWHLLLHTLETQTLHL